MVQKNIASPHETGSSLGPNVLLDGRLVPVAEGAEVGEGGVVVV